MGRGVGIAVGQEVGAVVALVDACEGARVVAGPSTNSKRGNVGHCVGGAVGAGIVGSAVGEILGCKVGGAVGGAVGDLLGCDEGIFVLRPERKPPSSSGACVGDAVGQAVGPSVTSTQLDLIPKCTCIAAPSNVYQGAASCGGMCREPAR